jgi:hypothetical protein
MLGHRQYVHTVCACRSPDQIADYTNRGRQHRGLSDHALISAWVASINQLAADPLNSVKIGQLDDFECEFRLRGNEPPYQQYETEVQRYLDSSQAETGKLRHSDPNAEKVINQNLDEEMRKFNERKDRSN